MTLERGFQEPALHDRSIRELGLSIEGTRLEPLVARVKDELEARGIVALEPHFYLSTEWGVPFETISVGIPFYLARPELVTLHAELAGHVEGIDDGDILRYLRHELGHVVNYAYRLYQEEEWVRLFGAMSRPYLEEYRPEPFSTRFVQHLPGWYAQKHPDEDWAETFAVWLTPGLRWQELYAESSAAAEKLRWCAAKMAELGSTPPPVAETELDEHVGDIAETLREFYGRLTGGADEPMPRGLEGALRAIFEDLGRPEISDAAVDRLPASDLLRRLEHRLMRDVYRWTGHLPERTKTLLRHLAELADGLSQVYPKDREEEAIVAVTALVTSLATNYVHRGSYLG